MKKALLLIITVVVSLCVGYVVIVPGSTTIGISPKPNPSIHEVRLVVSAINESTGRPISISVHIFVDVVLADGRHGIRKENGLFYPWDSTDRTPTGSDIENVRHGQGTNFTVIASTAEPVLPGLVLRCNTYEDNSLVSDFGANQERRLTTTSKDIKSIGVECHYHLS